MDFKLIASITVRKRALLNDKKAPLTPEHIHKNFLPFLKENCTRWHSLSVFSTLMYRLIHPRCKYVFRPLNISKHWQVEFAKFYWSDVLLMWQTSAQSNVWSNYRLIPNCIPLQDVQENWIIVMVVALFVYLHCMCLDMYVCVCVFVILACKIWSTQDAVVLLHQTLSDEGMVPIVFRGDWTSFTVWHSRKYSNIIKMSFQEWNAAWNPKVWLFDGSVGYPKLFA